MKTTVKRTVLVAILIGAGALLVYGPGFSGFGTAGHHGSWQGIWSGNMMNMGYDPGTFIDGDVDARLDQIKVALDIKPEQEAAWNDFAASVKSSAANERSMHQRYWPDGGTVSAQERRVVRQTMLRHLQAVHEAAGKLIDELDEQQRLRAGDLIGYGLQHPF